MRVPVLRSLILGITKEVGLEGQGRITKVVRACPPSALHSADKGKALKDKEE